MLIDTHCHLQGWESSVEVSNVIRRAKESEVEKMICIGTNIQESVKAIELAASYNEVFAAVGIYPHEEIPSEGITETLIHLGSQKKVVAVGEIGLDYKDLGSPGTNPKEAQKELFRKQVGAAVQLDLPLIIHNRNADRDILEELNRYKEAGKLRGVFHCFVSDIQFASEVLDLGFYISFTAIITYPSGANLEEVVKFVPLNRILVETDSPYLSPQGMRKERNEPKNVKIVAERIAQIRNTTLEDIAVTTSKNAQKLFKI